MIAFNRNGLPDPHDNFYSQKIRVWWHTIIRNFGRYKTYSVFLVLPQDKAILEFLAESYEELLMLSGNSNLILMVGENEIYWKEFSLENVNSIVLWTESIKKRFPYRFSKNVSRLFKIKMVDLPGLVIFKDIRTPEHIYIKLKGMDSDEIGLKMREIFTVIEDAVYHNQDPLEALSKQDKNEKLMKAGKTIVSEVRSLGKKTLEIIIESIIKAETNK